MALPSLKNFWGPNQDGLRLSPSHIFDEIEEETRAPGVTIIARSERHRSECSHPISDSDLKLSEEPLIPAGHSGLSRALRLDCRGYRTPHSITSKIDKSENYTDASNTPMKALVLHRRSIKETGKWKREAKRRTNLQRKAWAREVGGQIRWALE